MRFKLQIFIYFALFIIHSTLFTVTWEVKQDSTGDFLEIQNAIEEAVDNDTILVYPGIYYENVDFLSKAITLGSLVLTTDTLSYRNSTIIDANHYGRCVKIDSVFSGEATLCGFTIQNGNANGDGWYTQGGGVFIKDCFDILISKNIIKNNFAKSTGGGILVGHSTNVLVKGNVVNRNKALFMGGGVASTPTQIIFDETEKNSIYLNNAAMGADICHWQYGTSAPNYYETVYLDTFTVSENSMYYSTQQVESAYHLIEVNSEHYIYEEIDGDLFVSTNGNDSNSGLTPEEPLQTLWMAMQKIKSNPEARNTIFLADGVYTESGNNQTYPVQLKSYVNIEGESEEGTIFDGEGVNCFLKYRTQLGGNTLSYFTITNMTVRYLLESCIENRVTPVLEFNNESLTMKHITITNNQENPRGREAMIGIAYRFYMDNCTLKNNLFASTSISSQNLNEYGSLGEITNTKFCNNQGYLAFMSLPHDTFEFSVKNCLIANNNYSTPSDWYVGTINMQGVNKVNIINSTIVNNSTLTGGAITAGGPYTSGEWVTNINLINSIMSNNSPANAYLTHSNTLSVDHSLIDGGSYTMHVSSGLNWEEGNLDENPRFLMNEEDFPDYYLSNFSPAINAGTPDTTGLHLPEFDLAGNPRIFDGRIDMGCYEWQGEVGTENPNNIPQPTTKLSCYPNPFNPSTTINLVIRKAGYGKLQVFNIKGQLVDTIIDTDMVEGEHTIKWSINEVKGKSFASGQYFLKFTLDGDVVAKKMMLLK